MLVFENFTFFIKFFRTEAIDKQFYYYGYSKIVLTQFHTNWKLYDFFYVYYFL